MTLVRLDARRIHDWESFHTLFAEVFGFPSFYGRNRNAWIDCMSSLDSPDSMLSSIHVPAGGILILELDHVNDFAKRCPEQYAMIVEGAAFVNWRRLDQGRPPILALSYFKRDFH